MCRSGDGCAATVLGVSQVRLQGSRLAVKRRCLFLHLLLRSAVVLLLLLLPRTRLGNGRGKERRLNGNLPRRQRRGQPTDLRFTRMMLVFAKRLRGGRRRCAWWRSGRSLLLQRCCPCERTAASGGRWRVVFFRFFLLYCCCWFIPNFFGCCFVASTDIIFLLLSLTEISLPWLLLPLLLLVELLLTKLHIDRIRDGVILGSMDALQLTVMALRGLYVSSNRRRRRMARGCRRRCCCRRRPIGVVRERGGVLLSRSRGLLEWLFFSHFFFLSETNKQRKTNRYLKNLSSTQYFFFVVPFCMH